MRTDILQQAQAIRASMDAAAIVLTDEQATKAPRLYPTWAAGLAVKAGDRLYYSGTDRLYKVVSDHTTQTDWTPDAVPALYTVIDVAHSGTQDDPIPYNGNMALTEGLYYTQGGVTYLCNRSTGQPVYNALAELVGIYVEVV